MVMITNGLLERNLMNYLKQLYKVDEEDHF